MGRDTVLPPRMTSGETRTAGILLHPSSLPGRFSVGDAGPGAFRFLSWLAAAQQGIWQVLPLGPTGGGDSPYGAASAFAGNPILISPEALVEDGWLDAAALEESPPVPAAPPPSSPPPGDPAAGAPGSSNAVNFRAAAVWKQRLLRAAWERLPSMAPEWREAFDAFRSAPAQAYWLPDWALFAAAKRARGGAGWMSWEPGLAARQPEALARARAELAAEIEYEELVQFLFFRQWDLVREEARSRGVEIVGDLPIYVALDSADVWAHRELFALDADGRPERIAGVPPDYFSATGQLWGYPVYRWDACAREGYRWWIERLRINFRLADTVRIDHFRGFVAFWEVPAGEETAANGRWSPGPGRALFDAARAAMFRLPLIAEDLGTITEDVEALREELRIPGMKVLHFAFSEDDSPHLPHRHSESSVAYTGTHDNDTTRGWAAALSPAERERFTAYTGIAEPSAEHLVRIAYESVARRAIVPFQDVLDLGSGARMNTPGLASGNWTWRAREEDFTDERAARLRRLADLTGRVRR